MSQYDLYQEEQELRRKLDQCIKLLRKSGTELAEADRAYYTKRAAVSMQLRDDGMAVGMIDLVIRGYKEVAELRYKREAAKVFYDANREAINSYKLQLRLVENQLQREWGAAGTGGM